jgi:hypothetical protein
VPQDQTPATPAAAQEGKPAAPAAPNDAAAQPSEVPLLRRCDACSRTIEIAYYAVGNKFICPNCKDQLAGPAPGKRPLLRAFKYGSLAALAGSVVWGTIIHVTGYELGLIAIAIGYAVGIAVRKGSSGRGGRKFQILAVALTYLSITSSYVPMIVKQLVSPPVAAASSGSKPSGVPDIGIPKLALKEPTAASSPHPAPAAPASAKRPPMGAFSALVLFFGIVWGIALCLPFLNGLSNAMGLLIIGFGLYEAFRLNRAVAITGPYAVPKAGSGQPDGNPPFDAEVPPT